MKFASFALLAITASTSQANKLSISDYFYDSTNGGVWRQLNKESEQKMVQTTDILGGRDFIDGEVGDFVNSTLPSREHMVQTKDIVGKDDIDGEVWGFVNASLPYKASELKYV